MSLLLLAVPRTIASWEAIPADRIIAKLGRNAGPSPAEFTEGVAVLRRSVEQVASNRRLSDLGMLEYEQARQMFMVNPDRKPLLASSETHLLEALAANPIDGVAWYRLAQTRASRLAPPRATATALLQSLDVSPSLRWLWLMRAQALFTYAGALQNEELLAVRAHLRTIWKADPDLRLPLFRLATGAGNVPLLNAALDVDVESKAEFEKLKQSLQ